MLYSVPSATEECVTQCNVTRRVLAPILFYKSMYLCALYKPERQWRQANPRKTRVIPSYKAARSGYSRWRNLIVYGISGAAET